MRYLNSFISAFARGFGMTLGFAVVMIFVIWFFT
jgi:hypothetical protein